MTYQLRSRMRHVSTRMDEIQGETVHYYVDSTHYFELTMSTAMPSSRDAEYVLPGNIRVTMLDFFCNKADLEYQEAAFLPQRGQKIYRPSNGTTYLITPPSDDEPCWEPVLDDKSRLRIHTKEVLA
ncbi:MAG: hypothetical protein ACWGQW_06220 [bacterium]